jgi:hypothetical protein
MPLQTLYTAKDGIVQYTLAAPYTQGSGTMTLSSGGGNFPSGTIKFTAITRASYNTGPAEVLCVYSGILSGNTIGSVTALAGSTDQNFSTNDYIEMRLNALDINSLNTLVAPLNTPGSSGTVLTSTGTGTAPTWQPASGGTSLTITPVKTANYTAAVGEFVRGDVTGGSFTVTLPTAPATGTPAGAKIVTAASPNSNTLSVACGGSDVFNVAGGSTTLVLATNKQGVYLEYTAGSPGVWTVIADDEPPGGIAGQVQYKGTNGYTGAANAIIDSNSLFNVGTAVADPGTPVAGALWPSSTSKGAKFARNASLVQGFTGPIFRMTTAGAALVNTSSKATLLSGAAGDGSLTIPAGFVTAGMAFRFHLIGIASWTGTPTFSIAIQLGSVVILSGQTGALVTTQTNVAVGTTIIPVIHVGSLGASGSAGGTSGAFVLGNNTPGFSTLTLFNQGTMTGSFAVVDWTANQTFDVQGTWSAASSSNTLQITRLIIEII